MLITRPNCLKGVLDISAAFLHAEIPGGVKYFLKKPKSGLGADVAFKCFEAFKAVCGLRISPRAFQEHFVRMEIKRSVADPQMFFGFGDFVGGFMTAWAEAVMIAPRTCLSRS